MRRLAARLAVLAVLALAAGCSKDPAAPVAPPPAPPPGLVASEPPAFAAHVLDDTPVWGQFSRLLDPRTVDTTTVFLKVDTRRVPVSVEYESFTRRVIVRPRSTLSLSTTYTVEFSPEVRDTGGVRLGRTVFFQFTTSSLRRPRVDYPAAGEVESPFATLAWSTTAAPGTVPTYELYTGLDSMTVALRQVPAVPNGALTNYYPARPWPRGARVYWAVTAVNAARGDRVDGATQAFVTFGSDAAVDSLVLGVQDWSGTDPQRFQYCTLDRVWSGPLGVYSGGMRFALANRRTLRLSEARLELHTAPEYADSVAQALPGLALWAAQADWTPCAARVPGPPTVDPLRMLARARAGTDPRQVVFAGDTLAAFFEWQARRGGQFGPAFQSTPVFPYLSGATLNSADRPRLVLTFFVPTSVALARVANAGSDKPK